MMLYFFKQPHPPPNSNLLAWDSVARTATSQLRPSEMTCRREPGAVTLQITLLHAGPDQSQLKPPAAHREPANDNVQLACLLTAPLHSHHHLFSAPQSTGCRRSWDPNFGHFKLDHEVAFYWGSFQGKREKWALTQSTNQSPMYRRSIVHVRRVVISILVYTPTLSAVTTQTQ